MARWAVTLLAVAGAALLAWSGVIHLQLWSDGYRDISVIGPLFLIQGIASIVLALALAVFRRLALLAAGAVTAAATAVGLLLSAGIGLFGYTESLAVPDAELSLVVEFTAAAVLAAAAAILLAAPPRRPVHDSPLAGQSLCAARPYVRVCRRWEPRLTGCRTRHCSPVLARATPTWRSPSCGAFSGSCSASR